MSKKIRHQKLLLAAADGPARRAALRPSRSIHCSWTPSAINKRWSFAYCWQHLASSTDAKCCQQYMHRPTTVAFSSHSATMDVRLRNFSIPGFAARFQREVAYTYFWRYLNFLKTQCMMSGGKPAIRTAVSMPYRLATDRLTDRHTGRGT